MLVFTELAKPDARKAREFAWSAYKMGGDALCIWKSWRDNMRYLQTYACKCDGIVRGKESLIIDSTRTVVLLGKDFAPLSFSLSWWSRKPESPISRERVRAMLAREDWDLFHRHYYGWMSGGLIYHGPHDNFGGGGAPTFSVSIGQETAGWVVHT